MRAKLLVFLFVVGCYGITISPSDPFCGDGLVDANEECDDGNTINDDTCRVDCTLPGCGDGVVDAGEQCEPPGVGNCGADCLFLPPLTCPDGFVDPGEDCDDGNIFGGDGCRANCTIEACGDGILDPGEQCDDGNQIDGDACTNQCSDARCGDGVAFDQGGTEECDDGNVDNNDSCLTTCVAAACGDNIIQIGVEECDDGNQVNTDGCTNQCNNARCGDNIVLSGVEQCDDGNQVDGDACTNQCNNARCGDGVIFNVGGAEACDDGNQADNDACLPVTCQAASCGDGFIQVGVESCDPPNGGACNAQCQLACVNSPDCNDSDACTINERCINNVCLSDPLLVDDNNACTVDSCNPTAGAVHEPAAFISDNNACTDDVCTPANGSVTHDPIATIDDADACTDDSCDPVTGIDSHSPVNVDDGSPCTDDSCDPVTGTEHTPVDTSDGDACTVDGCDQVTGIFHTPIGVDDNNACTDDSCDPVSGVIHTPIAAIDDGNECTVDSCDPATGDDSHSPAPDGNACDADNNAATRDICLVGACDSSVCGDSFLDPAVLEECDDPDFGGETCQTQGFASGTLACDGSCQFDTTACIAAVTCGDGDIDAGETCDDSNTNANDGCNSICQLEADFFVSCGNAANGNGSLANPFNSVTNALAVVNNAKIFILPQSPANCNEGVTVNESTTIIGLADPNDPTAPTPKTVNGGTNPAFTLGGAQNITIKIQDLVLLSNSSGNGTVDLPNAANQSLALLRVDISNTNSAAGSVAVDCDQPNTSELLIDQSVIHNSPAGGLLARRACLAVVSNSLFQNNGSAASAVGAIEATAGEITVIYSTFVDNLDSAAAGTMDCGAASVVRGMDSCIVDNGSTNTIDADCFVTNTDVFLDGAGGVSPPAGAGNIDLDPLFVAGADFNFHLAASSPARDVGSAATAVVTNVFDPNSIFGVNLFTHDFSGGTRPLNGAPDMGMFEEP